MVIVDPLSQGPGEQAKGQPPDRGPHKDTGNQLETSIMLAGFKSKSAKNGNKRQDRDGIEQSQDEGRKEIAGVSDQVIGEDTAFAGFEKGFDAQGEEGNAAAGSK